jgi:phage terminase large subunit
LGAQGKRYKVIYGGRGAQKSWAVADYLIARACQEKLRILCTREIQNSIKDSVYRLLCDRIAALGLDKYFTIKADSIVSLTGSEFIFKGLRLNIQEIKSTEGIDICWVEEAGKVSESSWVILIPTIRKENSEIIVTFNPELESDPAYQRFVLHPSPDCISEETSYEDNDCFPEVLRREMEWCKKTDPDAYEHIWLGKLKGYADALIFKGKFFIEEFDTPEDTRFYYGADFGFSVDAMWMGRVFIKDKCLYIPDEIYGVGIEVDDMPKYWEKVPESKKWPIRADSARPDTISYLKRQGFNVIGAEKGQGSVEDGISFLRSFEKIIIHPRCQGAKHNFENYRWKQDRITQEILPVPVDKHNHACFSGDTKILMGDGLIEKNISDIIVGEEVMTSCGPQRVLESAMTNSNAIVKKFLFSNGQELIATPDHPVYSQRGRIGIDDLRYDDIIYSWKKYCLMDKNTDGMGNTMFQSGGAQKGEKDYTRRFGNSTEEVSRKDSIFTILTITLKIILSAICNVSRKINIFLTTQRLCRQTKIIEINKKRILKKLGILPPNGIIAKKAQNGIVNTLSNPIRREQPRNLFAPFVEKISLAKRWLMSASVQTPVNQSGEEDKRKTILSNNALSAQKISQLTNIQNLSPVRLVAALPLLQKIKVYNLTVDKEHNYFANGILVSNCDAIRYALEPYIKKSGSEIFISTQDVY